MTTEPEEQDTNNQGKRLTRKQVVFMIVGFLGLMIFGVFLAILLGLY